MAALLLSGCGPGLPEGHPHPDFTGHDSVLATERRLIGLVSYIDAYGRESAALPPDLDRVAARFQPVAERRVDIWGRAVRYSLDGQRFELRSAGEDSTFATTDDIVVSGQLGRAVPCEVRTEERTFNYDDQAPPCSEVPGPVLLLCPDLEHADAAEASLPPLSDPVAATGQRLVGLARRADWQGRRVGGAPPSQRAIFGFREPVDAWGNPVRYTHNGATFEMRSAGVDGSFETADDIIVSSRFGLLLECSYRNQNGSQRCEAQPPSCPVLSTGAIPPARKPPLAGSGVSSALRYASYPVARPTLELIGRPRRS